MSFFSILYTLLFYPLELFFEVVFSISNRVLHPGLSIIVLSLVMNILALPLYRRADQLQVEEKDREAKLRPWINHIKKYFKGSERFMMLQTFYRENHYKPTDSLKGSISLLLEIPFFIAAYHFLSHVQLLNGVSFGPLTDLGTPDQLLTLFGYKINLLPLIMTAINIVASCIYLKGMPLKSKVQLYGVAGIFLILLYSSPSGLVFYWTLNNLFSLVKNIFYKLHNPKRILACLFSALGLLSLLLLAFHYRAMTVKIKFFIFALAFVFQTPLFAYVMRSKLRNTGRIMPQEQPGQIYFLCPMLALAILTGLLIPSSLIHASPEEFIDSLAFVNPIQYVFWAFFIAVGAFIIWGEVFYLLSSKTGKSIFEEIAPGILICGIVNYMLWGTHFGYISPFLQYDHFPSTFRTTDCINLAVLGLCFIATLLLARHFKKNMLRVNFVLLLSILAMSLINIFGIQSSINRNKAKYLATSGIRQEKIRFPFSKKGKNVFLLMLDRAINSYLPYIFAEKPELKRQFAGFTYYPNTLSFGPSTMFGSSSLYGGYEYTPEEMNKRGDELLRDKHNEALKVLPVLFDMAGAKVTVCDPSLANYEWFPNLSIYKDYPRIRTFHTMGAFNGDPQTVLHKKIRIWNRNFFCHSIFRIIPTFVQEQFYWAGSYSNPNNVSLQMETGLSTAVGQDINFMKSYQVLKNLPDIVSISESPTNTFLMMSNDTAHDPMLLQRPDYVPAMTVDNRKYDIDLNDRIVGGRRMKMDNHKQLIFYHSNMAAMLLLGEWFDFLRENGIYDNTRIIIVADHGTFLGQFEDMLNADINIDMESFHPLLLVKDFNSTEFQTDRTFMTNADAPWLALEGIVSQPCNPFTGKFINDQRKENNNILNLILASWKPHIGTEDYLKRFISQNWLSIKKPLPGKSVFMPENWAVSVNKEKLDKGMPLTE